MTPPKEPEALPIEPDEIIWAVGILMGFVAIAVAIAINRYNPFDLATYKTFLPSVSFIGVSVSALAVAESFNLVLSGERQQFSQKERVAGLTLCVTNILLLLAAITTYSVQISNSGAPTFVVSAWDIIVSVFWTAVSIIVAFRLKRSLR